MNEGLEKNPRVSTKSFERHVSTQVSSELAET